MVAEESGEGRPGGPGGGAPAEARRGPTEGGPTEEGAPAGGDAPPAAALAAGLVASPVAAFLTDAAGVIVWANAAFERQCGHDRAGLLGRTPALLRSGRHGPEVYAELWATIAAGRSWRGLLVNRRRDGTEYTVRQAITPVLGAEGRPTHHLALHEDVTDEVAVAARTAHEATHDALTDLPNRRLFLELLGRELTRARRHGAGLAVHFLDLDHFKEVNDALGHATGDALLVAVARRLEATLRASDALARFGGDELVALQTDVAAAGDAQVLAQKLLDALAAPFVVEGHTLRTGASLGVALWLPGAPLPQPEALLEQADQALYHVKRAGRGTWALHDPGMTRRMSRRASLSRDVDGALARGELGLVFRLVAPLGQGPPGAISPPADDAAPGPHMLDAAARWRHPGLGELGERELEAAAVERGLLGRLVAWQLDAACLAAARWPGARDEPGPAGWRVCVPLSGLALGATGLDLLVERALAEAGLAPGRLVLSLPDATVLSPRGEHAPTFARLASAGVGLAAHGVGAGAASLLALRRVHLVRLTLASDLAATLPDDPLADALVRAFVAAAVGARALLVADGVESDAQRDALRALGVPAVAGPLLGPAVPPEDVPALLLGQP